MSPAETANLISAIAGSSAVLAALGIALWQTRLSRRIHNEQQSLATRLQENEGKLLREMHAIETKLSQRQALFNLWPSISALPELSRNDPSPHSVTKAINTLELVAVCWEAEIVEKEVLRRVFEMPFIEMYDSVNKVPYLEPLKATGTDLLRKCPAIGRLYGQMSKEVQDRLAPSSLS